MVAQVKPNVNVVWASDGEAKPVPPEKQAKGYIAEIPFFDDFNGHMQQLSAFQKHVNEQGIAFWDEATVYPVGGSAKSPVDFNVYRCTAEQAGNPPVSVIGGAVNSNWVRWSYTLPELLSAISDLFVGSVTAFAAAPTEPGWLLCNGAAVSRATYSRLFSKIGTTYGPGNGTTTFNLPEMRGETIRGLDLGRGVDAGRMLGSFQDHAVARHYHYLPTQAPTGPVGTRWGILDSVWVDNGSENSNPWPVTGQFARTYPDSDMGKFADENRVRNVAFPYYIKF